jgi:glycosyltransferase involved in cell wall biosynthesis
MRIVLDLSTSLAWTRPPVGIVRTERKFAQHLLASDALEVAFCRFDKQRAVHVELSRDEAMRIVGATPAETAEADVVQPRESAMTPSPPAPVGQPRPPLKSRVARVLKSSAHRTLHRLPEVLRPEARAMFIAGREFGNRAHTFSGRYWRWLRGRFGRSAAGVAPGIPVPAASSTQEHAFAFRRDDVYASMGLDWEYNDLAVLYRERARTGFRTLLFCYDTIPVRFPHLMSFDARQYFARYFTDLAHVADRVVAISEASKHDFLGLMGEVAGPRPCVDVVLLGTDLDAPASTIKPPLPELEGAEFVLCVSTIEARKNHDVLYHVWDRLNAEYADSAPRLVLVGMVGWGVADLLFRMRTNPRLKDRIVILDNLPDGELAWLYRHCHFTVFPSLYEGWGLPVVESLALGKPCICSTAPAVVEAAQGMAMALDPVDTPAWYSAVLRMWREPELRDASVRRLHAEFRANAWRDHGEALIAIARDLQVERECASSS